MGNYSEADESAQHQLEAKQKQQKLTEIKKHKKKFKWTKPSDYTEPLKPDYLIRGLLNRRQFSQFWGPPKSGKSFLLLHMLAHIALGKPLFSRKVKQAAVGYVSSEGQEGINNRVCALVRKMPALMKCDHFHILAKQINIYNDPVNSFEQYLIDEIRERELSVLCIDTLARSTAGMSENDSKDMSAVVARLDRIREEGDCHIIVVHHSTKAGGNSSRGHSSLEGAIDLSVKIELVKEDEPLNMQRKAVVLLNKDDAPGLPMCFELQEYNLGTDDEGIMLHTLVVNECHQFEEDRKPKIDPAKLKLNQKLLWQCFLDCRANKAMPIPKGPFYPSVDVRGVTEDDLFNLFDARKTDGKALTRNAVPKGFTDSLEMLTSGRLLAKYENYIWCVQDVLRAESISDLPVEQDE